MKKIYLESEDDIKNQFITIDELMNDIENVLINENVSPIKKYNNGFKINLY